MKAGLVDPELGLLIRYTTYAFVCLFIVAPFFAGGFGTAFQGFAAVYSYVPCWFLLAVTTVIGMYSFLCLYTGIDIIGATKALCLNVTFILGCCFLVHFVKVFPAVLSGALSWLIVVGALLFLAGVAMTTLYKPRENHNLYF